MSELERLVSIVARLRSPGGCPWDRAQTPETMRPYVIEEAYEVVEAVDSGSPEKLREELGDLLFQVALLSRMAEEAGWFNLEDVAAGIGAKMVRRHPHVFDPDHREEDAGSVGAWEARKARERGADASMLSGVPEALPALLRAHRVGEKVARVGFDWSDRAAVRAKVDEELAELDEALALDHPEEITHEYGDVLLTLAHLGRFVGVPGEDALRIANHRFARRFRALERLAAERGVDLHSGLSEPEFDALWGAVKAAERGE